ncbi:stage III sporulation protein SpoAB [Pelotomaculum schinkii]|uniref:Stage III sporulation protein SpoAB n=1 Tax=Pelotomaculum schinkii TaxID=78350 RepID=A0A4Y7RD37_9FIRM|nr:MULTISPECIES: stage III sporulation protein SpoIIIAB [Pelotomaculum]TEB06651.1 stage III sporulation protein SpoAB [Pelotomaculum schinkii]TEB17554.1 stage III sporulation protein SpoAB [Pelotomaculum sp. FP]
MLKFFGAAMVIAASGLSGLAVAGSYARRPRELRALRSALQMLETEIMYGATRLPEALDTVASRCDQLVGPLFKQAGVELAAMSGVSAAEAWEKALAKYYPASALKPSDHSILIGLGRSLGRSDCADQVKHLRLAMEQVAQEAANAEEDASRNVKMWSYLGFLGGLVFVLVAY